MSIQNCICRNEISGFDLKQMEILGRHVYALIDPESKEIFYIGQSDNNPHRLFDHFREAQEAYEGKRKRTDKINKIIEIWNSGRKVQYMILASGLADKKSLDVAEAVAYTTAKYALRDNTLLGEYTPPNDSSYTQEQLNMISAPEIDLSAVKERSIIFVFSIKKTYDKESVYEATRKAWRANKYMESHPSIPQYGIGLVNQVSVGSYRISKWDDSDFAGRRMFEGDEYEPFFMQKWKKIVNCTPNVFNAWKRVGGTFVIELNGKGKWRIMHNCSDHEWRDCK